MPPTRRAVVIGTMLGAAGIAPSLLAPHARAERTRGRPLTALIPAQVGSWRRATGGDIVTPETPGEARAYDDVLQWSFASPVAPPVMLAVAYGLAASRHATTHRPEGCYTAQGFSILRDAATPVRLSSLFTIPAIGLLATRADRAETVLYWRRIGNTVISGKGIEAVAYLRSAWHGVAADGTLVRMSMIGVPFDRALSTLGAFARTLIASASPTARDVMLGEATP